MSRDANNDNKKRSLELSGLADTGTDRKKNKIVPMTAILMGFVGAATLNITHLNDPVETTYIGDTVKNQKLAFIDQDGNQATFIKGHLKYIALKLDDSLKVKDLYYLWADGNIDIKDINNKVTTDQMIATPTRNGNYNLYVLVIDEDGNKYLNISETLYVDDKNPIVEFKTPSSTYENGSKVKISVRDNESGIEKVTYAWAKNGQTPNLNKAVSGSSISPPKTDGTYYLYVRAEDRNGNVTTKYNGPYTFKTSVIPSNEITETPKAQDEKVKEESVPVTKDKTPNKTETNAPSSPSKTPEVAEKASTNTAVDSNVNGGSVEESQNKTGPKLKVVNINPVPTGVFKSTHQMKILANDTVLVKILNYEWTQDIVKPTYYSNSVKYGEKIETPEETGVYYLHAYAKNILGKVTESSFGPYYVDSTEPAVFLSAYSKEFMDSSFDKVLVKAIDDESGIKSISYSWSPSKTKPNAYTKIQNYTEVPLHKSGEQYLHLLAVDNSGNITKHTSELFKVDNIAPRITLTSEGQSKFKQQHDISLSVVDPETGVSDIHYEWSNSETKLTDLTNEMTGNEKIIQTPESNGTYYLHVKAIDEKGNEAYHISKAYKVDRIAPVLTVSKNGNTRYENDTEIYVQAEDEFSGMDKVVYEWTTSPSEPSDYTKDIGINGKVKLPTVEGHYYLHVKGIDKAGNEATWTSEKFLLDLVSPTVEIENPRGLNEYTTDGGVTVKFEDGVSSIASSEYSWTNSEHTPSTFDHHFDSNDDLIVPNTTGDHYLHIKVADDVGNETIKTFGPFKIDVTAPIITQNVESGSVYEQSHQVSVAATDENTSVASIQYKWEKIGSSETSYFTGISNGDVIETPNATGEYTLHVKAIDALGNESTKISGPYNVDLDAPTIDFTQDGNTEYKTKHNVVVTAADPLAGLEEIAYEWSESSNRPSEFTNTMQNGDELSTPNETGRHYLHVRSTDKAGNVAYRTTTNSFNVDVTAPTIELSKNGDSEYALSHNVAVYVTDNTELDEIRYVWSKSTAAPATYDNVITSSTTLSTPSETGSHYLHVMAKDRLGNTITLDSRKYNVDLDAPIAILDIEDGLRYKLKHDINVFALDQHRNVSEVEYRWSESISESNYGFTTIDNNATITTPEQTGQFYLHIRMTDDLGNVQTGISGPYNVDLDAPTFNVQPDGSTDYDAGYDVVVDYEDLRAGVEVARYKWTDSTEFPESLSNEFNSGDVIRTPYVSGEHFLHFEVIDKLGNRATYTTNGYLVDADAPTISVSNEGDDEYALEHSTVLTVDDDSTVASIKYTWSNSVEVPDTYTEVAQSGDTIVTPTTTGSHYLHVWADDRYGNVSKYVSNVFNVDLDAPIAKLSPADGSKYELAYSAKVDVEDKHREVSSIAYKWSESDLLNSDPYTTIDNGEVLEVPSATGTYYLHLKLIDDLGNEEETVSGAYNIDLTNPEFTLSQVGNLSAAIHHYIAFNFADLHAGIETAKYEWTLSSELPENFTNDMVPGQLIATPDFSETHYMHIQLVDKLGNTTTYSTNGFVVDITKPIIEVSQEGNDVYSKEHSVTIDARDEHSSVASLKYVWTDSQDEPAAYPSVITSGDTVTTPVETGLKYLHVEAIDDVGNVQTYTSNAFYIDNEAPIPHFSKDGNSIAQQTQSTVVTIKEPNSGLATAEYEWSQSSSTPASFTNEFASGDELEVPIISGDWYLHVKLVDNLGNTRYVTTNHFRLDVTQPTVSLSSDGIDVYTNTPTTVVTASDVHSFVKEIQYEWTTESEAPTEYTQRAISGDELVGPLVSGNYYLHLKVIDEADNVTTMSSNVFNIDVDLPETSFSVNSGSDYSDSYSTNVTYSDVLSDIVLSKYTWTNSASTPTSYPNNFVTGDDITTPNESGNWFLHIEVTDRAGNVKVDKTDAFNIDVTAPVITFSMNGNSQVHYVYKTRVNAEDPQSGLAKLEYAWSTSTSKPSDSSYTTISSGDELTTPSPTARYYLHVRAIDNLGNVNETVTNYFNINYDLDSDGDLVTDRIEDKYGLDRFNTDTDGDGVPDGKARIITTYTTNESRNVRNITYNINLPSLSSIEKVTTNTGNGTVASISGDAVSLSLKSGSVVRSVLVSGYYTPSDTKYVTGQSSSSYSSGGYYGSLSQYVVKGSASASKSISGHDSPSYSESVSDNGVSTSFSGSLSQYVVSGSAAATHTDTATCTNIKNYSMDKDANTTKTSDSPCPSSYTKSFTWTENGTTYGGSFTLSRTGDVTNYDTCTALRNSVKAGTSTGGSCSQSYTASYKGSISKPDTRKYAYKGTATKPDTRVYAYQGNVTKDAVDTRVYDYYYKYTVTVQYLEDIMPEH